MPDESTVQLMRTNRDLIHLSTSVIDVDRREIRLRICALRECVREYVCWSTSKDRGGGLYRGETFRVYNMSPATSDDRRKAREGFNEGVGRTII